MSANSNSKKEYKAALPMAGVPNIPTGLAKMPLGNAMSPMMPQMPMPAPTIKTIFILVYFQSVL